MVGPIKKKPLKHESEIEVFAGVDRKGNIYVEVCEVDSFIHTPTPFMSLRASGRTCKRAIIYVGNIDRAVKIAEKIKLRVLAAKPRSIDEAFQIIAGVLRGNDERP